MAVRITHIRMSAGGSGHEHITNYQWLEDDTGRVDSSTKATMVDWINNGGSAYVSAGGSRVNVGVVNPQSDQPYLRTYADGVWTDNLLLLPRF